MADLTLTQKGKNASNDPTIRGVGALFLDYLAQNGPSDIATISRGLRVPERVGKRIANSLARKGYIEREAGE